MLCACGCGEEVRYKGAKFRQGHHLRKGIRRPEMGAQKLPRPKCLRCGKPCNKLGAIYCSRECSQQHVPITRGSIRRPCATCGKEMLIPANRQQDGRGQWCSKECYAAAILINHENGVGNWTNISGLAKRRANYACENCGYSRVPEILVTHHLDGVHGKDNSPENLRVLCPTCHAEHHFHLGSKRLGPTVR